MPPHESSEPLLTERDSPYPRANGRYHDKQRYSPRRCFSRQVVVGLVMLALVLGIATLAVYTGADREWNTPTPLKHAASHEQAAPPPAAEEIATSNRKMTEKEWEAAEARKYADPKNWLVGAPKQKFRDNLRKDVQYMSGWIAGGWTNDFMTYINLIYVAHITRPRVPIIGQFHPTHVGADAGFLHFGDVFDVPRLSAALRMPVLEWRDVKNETSTEVEEVGCWSAWQVSGSDDAPRHSFIPEIVGLDISYTAAPKEIKMSPDPWDWFVKFWPLAALAYPQGRAAALAGSIAPQQPSVLHNATHPPDEHMVCYDFLYFAGVEREDEWFLDYSPAWREVGTHVHWAPRIVALTDGYLARHFGTPAPPPFIAVHVRRSDFEGWCGDVPVPECFAPLDAFARRVDEVRAELAARGVRDARVLVTSDERDPAWWADVRARGWGWVDHAAERTEEQYGKWYPVLIDAVIQSMGAGFVGTDRSTMSMVAQRRVEDWQGGPTREVKWGWKGADDHTRRAWPRE